MKNVRTTRLTPLLVPLAFGIVACGPSEADSRPLADNRPSSDSRPPSESAISAQDSSSAGAGQRAGGDLVTIRAGGVEVRVEIADEPSEHSRGLMFRESLAENAGMLFIYPSERTLAFWMKNTLLPLDIAYADREGRIVDIQQMEPQTLDTHPSAAPAQYALEMNQGWFEANGVRVGDRIEF